MNTFVSPMQPVAPPAKKVKGNLDNIEAVRKRRQELSKLKEKHQMRAEKSTPGAAKLGPPVSNPSAPPAPPGPASLGRVRHSDIFPTVGKVAPRSIPPPRAGNISNISNIEPPSGARPGQASSSRMQHPTVEPVVRRLDQSFGQGKSPAPPPPGAIASRSHSAPPTRHTPPPGPPPQAKVDPEVTPSRSFAARPPPVTPGAKPKPIPTRNGAKAPPMAPPKETPLPPVSTPKVLPPPASSPMIPPAGVPVPQSSTPIVTNRQKMTPLPSGLPVPRSETTIPPAQGSDVVLPQKPRQNLIRNLHQFADSPGVTAKVKDVAPESSPYHSSMLRLEKQVSEHEKGKAEALRKVSILEEQVQKLKEKGDPEEELGVLVRMAEKDGDDAALQWARGRVSGTTPRPSASKVGFFSPLSPGLATPRSISRKRIATPRPKRNQEDNESWEDPGLFSESVNYVPFEYTSEHATFIVRRPYGKATESELWFQCGYMSSKQYEKAADIKKPHSLEIIAQITADSSTLSLNGSAFVRHICSDADADWVEFGSVDEVGKPLGSITYIDKDANEKDYSLDDIFEGALAARENYCTSVASLAVGLETKGGTIGKAITSSRTVPPGVVAQTSDIGVDTVDLPGPSVVLNDGGSGEKSERAPPKEVGPPIDIDDGPDMVSFVLQSFAGVLIWLVKTVLFTVPFRVVSFTVLSSIAFIVLSLVSLQLADDHGAVSMGAGFDSMHNRPGII